MGILAEIRDRDMGGEHAADVWEYFQRNPSILHYPDHWLELTAPSGVEDTQGSILNTIHVLHEAMLRNDGVGISAPQVGHSTRIILSPWNDTMYAWVDPIVHTLTPHVSIAEEGCLSLPGIYANVPRSDRVVVRAPMIYDIAAGEWRDWNYLVFWALEARIVQHEIDHLNGILFTDRMIPGTLVYRRREETPRHGSPEWGGVLPEGSLG